MSSFLFIFQYRKRDSKKSSVHVLCAASLTPRAASLTLSAQWEKRQRAPLPCRLFDRFILTGSALKLILYDFYSNFTTAVAYYGTVDSLLYRLSFKSWMLI